MMSPAFWMVYMWSVNSCRMWVISFSVDKSRRKIWFLLAMMIGNWPNWPKDVSLAWELINMIVSFPIWRKFLYWNERGL